MLCFFRCWCFHHRSTDTGADQFINIFPVRLRNIRFESAIIKFMHIECISFLRFRGRARDFICSHGQRDNAYAVSWSAMPMCRITISIWNNVLQIIRFFVFRARHNCNRTAKRVHCERFVRHSLQVCVCVMKSSGGDYSVLVSKAYSLRCWRLQLLLLCILHHKANKSPMLHWTRNWRDFVRMCVHRIRSDIPPAQMMCERKDDDRP